jgi:hypothetical protein
MILEEKKFLQKLRGKRPDRRTQNKRVTLDRALCGTRGIMSYEVGTKEAQIRWIF